jgi:hypothetical protein
MVRRRTLAGIECGATGHLMKIHALGIDLGKTVFHLVGLDSSGQVVVRKRCSRMEACSGAHFLGKALRAQGHDVRLLPAQYVKPCVKTNKSDYIEAEAIAEAVQRPRMRFVPIKTVLHPVQGQPLRLSWGWTLVQLRYYSKLFIIESLAGAVAPGSRRQRKSERHCVHA